jgi:hypothetical protein
MFLASRLASRSSAKDEKGSVLTIGTVTPAEEINVAKRMLAEKLLQLGLAHPPRHKQEWLLNLESFTDIHRKCEETPNAKDESHGRVGSSDWLVPCSAILRILLRALAQLSAV